MGNRYEETAVGNAVGIHTDGGGDVGLDRDILAGRGRDGEVNSGVGESALAVGGVEILDQGRERVELWRGCVPKAPNE